MKNLIPILGLILFISCKSDKVSNEEMAPTMEGKTMENQMSVYDINKTTLTWTAFKTEAKAGVKGTFDEITLDGNKFSINTKTVNSNEPKVRDPKLVKFFFDQLTDQTISGHYGEPNGNKIPVTIKMNGVEKTFEFNYELNDTATVVNGTIDIVSDFSGNAALESINEACFELHAGKTWSDVDINIVSLK